MAQRDEAVNRHDSGDNRCFVATFSVDTQLDAAVPVATTLVTLPR